MPKEANELCTIQRNEEEYDKLKRNIRRLGADNLAKMGPVSRQTFYKYLRGEPINQNKEDAIVEVVKQAIEAKEKADQARLETVNNLVEA